MRARPSESSAFFLLTGKIPLSLRFAETDVTGPQPSRKFRRATKMSLNLLIRPATAADLPEILRHRRGMYESMGYRNAGALSAMLSTCEPYLASALANGSFRSWLAEEGPRI